jgi:hypothetical protein
MMAEMQEQGLCNCAVVDVNDILEAIPGSRIDFIPNAGHMGSGKLLILPENCVTCPCGGHPDFYSMMRAICREATEDEVNQIVGCDSFSINSCEPVQQWRGQTTSDASTTSTIGAAAEDDEEEIVPRLTRQPRFGPPPKSKKVVINQNLPRNYTVGDTPGATPGAKFTIEFRLNIIKGDNGGSVLIPGCEPTSTLTSTTMMAEMREADICKGAIANVNDILEAIPGSRVEYLANAGHMGSGKLLVLPGYDQTCPCSERPDYYAIIRELGDEVTGDELEEILGQCDSFFIDSCDSRTQWRGQ